MTGYTETMSRLTNGYATAQNEIFVGVKTPPRRPKHLAHDLLCSWFRWQSTGLHGRI